MYRCKTCDAVLDNIPNSAVELTSGYRVKAYRFSNGEVHVLVRIPVPKKSGWNGHVRWHINRGIQEPDCKFCFPDQTPVESTPGGSEAEQT